MIKSQKGMKIRLHIQIRVNIPFIYKQDYRNIITELGAIICCQDFLPFFIDKKTKKRLIRSIPCKRKKKNSNFAACIFLQFLKNANLEVLGSSAAHTFKWND